jgi:hypothetical protein
MFNTKTLLLSTVAAAIVGVFVTVIATTLFPGWLELSPFIRGAVIGAFAGPIYPLLARRSDR